MTHVDGGETVGPIAEKTYGPGFINSLRKMARFVIGPKFEPMDLSDLNDDNDPSGMSLVPSGPANQRELYAHIKQLQDEGTAGPIMNDRGHGTRADGYTTTGFSAEGAPIVDAARRLRERKEGKIPLSDGVGHPQAKRLLEEVKRQRGKPATDPEK